MEDEFSQLSFEKRPPQMSPENEKPQAEDGVEVPFNLLERETLEQLIKSFVLREGTEYGEEEVPLARKIDYVRGQLEKGDLKIVFDLATDTGSIVSKR